MYNMTCEIAEAGAKCGGIAYTPTAQTTLLVGGALLIGVIGLFAAILVYRNYINADWKKTLIETGNAKAYMDVIASKRVYTVPKKGDEAGGYEPGL